MREREIHNQNSKILIKIAERQEPFDLQSNKTLEVIIIPRKAADSSELSSAGARDEIEGTHQCQRTKSSDDEQKKLENPRNDDIQGQGFGNRGREVSPSRGSSKRFLPFLSLGQKPSAGFDRQGLRIYRQSYLQEGVDESDPSVLEGPSQGRWMRFEQIVFSTARCLVH